MPLLRLFYLCWNVKTILKYVPKYWRGNLRERGHCGDPNVDGRIMLR
jgi:hypothetical protein